MLVAAQLSVLGLYLPPVLRVAATVAAPDDHFTASPDCCMGGSRSRRVGGAGGCPRFVNASARPSEIVGSL